MLLSSAQASIWCFFSISQIGIMLFAIRNVMLGRANDDPKDVPTIRFFGPWPMDVYDPKAAKAVRACDPACCRAHGL